MEGQKNTNKAGRRFHPHFFHWGRSPEQDWKIIFSISVIIVFCSIAASTFIFIKIDRGEIFLVEQINEESEETIDLIKLEETASYYKSKELKLEEIINSESRYVDPSL